MHCLLSAGWLYRSKRKSEIEPMREGEVVEIVQQALENPSANTTVTGKTNRVKSKNKDFSAVERIENQKTLDVEAASVISNKSSEYDPKVAEYFKDFPEPYRQKAIKRYSKREGLFRFDFYRNMKMENEWLAAMKRNIFLEDRREEEERQYQKWEEDSGLNEMPMYTLKKPSEDMPVWERKVLEYIPVAEDESTQWKLFSAFSLVAMAGAFIYDGVKMRHQIPKIGRNKAFLYMALRFGGAGAAGTGAVYRLMDWGPFNRTVDGRDFITGLIQDAGKDFETMINYLTRDK